MPSRTTLEPPTALDAPFGELDTAPVVVAPEHPGPGAWAGAPSALRVGSDIYLAYRLRRPVGQGRGFANVVARSADGVRFSTLATVGKDRLGAESLERPALVRTAGGTWRLYVSVATPGTKHWRVVLLESSTPEGLATASPRTVMPGSDRLAVKDPVIVRHDGQWHAWASCHPLDDPEATDRMTTEYATSADGVDWTWHGTALAGPGRPLGRPRRTSLGGAARRAQHRGLVRRSGHRRAELGGADRPGHHRLARPAGCGR